MVQVEKSIEINRPVEQVFYVVGAKWPRNCPRWSPSVKELQQTSEGPFGVGATVHQVREINGKVTPTTVTVTEYAENQALGLQTTGESVNTVSRYVFEPTAAGTKVTVSLDVEVGGMGRLAAPMITRSLNSELEGDLSRMKSTLESPTG